MAMTVWIPETPAGTVLDWLVAETEEQAWQNLLEDAADMPYNGVAGFRARGYQVFEYDVVEEVVKNWGAPT
jgi:hypothetical protein